MGSPNTVSGLIRKRSEIAGQIEHHQDALRQLIIDLDHLDATLRLFSPDIELEAIKPKRPRPKHAAERGELSKIILGALRQSEAGLDLRELTKRVLAERRIDPSDKALAQLIQKRVGGCLNHYRSKGLIESDGQRGELLVWRVR